MSWKHKYKVKGTSIQTRLIERDQGNNNTFKEQDRGVLGPATPHKDIWKRVVTLKGLLIRILRGCHSEDDRSDAERGHI